MIKRKGFHKIYFGWWIVLASGAIAMWGHGYRVFGFSALFKPIASELGFNRAVTSVASSIGRLEGGFEAPITGWVVDRFGPRWIVLSGIFIIGLSLILMNFVNSLWAFYMVWGVMLGTGSNIALSIPLDKAITDWFVKKRGLAQGVRWAFTGLAPVLVLPLVAWLISTQGWRMTLVIGGGVMLVVGLPLAWFSLKQHRPEYHGLLPDGATSEEEVVKTSQMIEKGANYAAEIHEVEFTLRQSLKTRAYWILVVAQACHALVGPVLFVHAIPFLTDMGIDPLKAAVMMAGMSASIIPGMFIGGIITDHLKVGQLRLIMAGAYLLEAIGVTVFLLDQTIITVYPFFILVNFGLGIGVPLNSILRARYFGRKAFGSIRGTSMMLTSFVGAIAPIYAGWVYDNTGSYITAFIVFAILLGVSAVVMGFATPPKPPAEVTDIRSIT